MISLRPAAMNRLPSLGKPQTLPYELRDSEPTTDHSRPAAGESFGLGSCQVGRWRAHAVANVRTPARPLVGGRLDQLGEVIRPPNDRS